MVLTRLAYVCCLAMLCLPPATADAMQFKPVPAGGNQVLIDGRGPIVPGDDDRLQSVLASQNQSGQTILALALDSGGGNVVEARRMASTLRSRRMAVVIPSNAQCASACFLLFAGAPRRFAAPDALIGVHSASQNGTETDTSLAVTTLMARDAADLGVPPVILGKMVETTPGRIAWLEPADLALMHVTTYNGDLLAALRQPAGSPSRGAPPAEAAPPIAEPRTAYVAANQERRAWETWLGGLTGAYREGALAARGQMPDLPPAACFGRDNTHRGDFTLGCEAARQRLAPIAEKIRTNPEYAAGWDAAPAPVAAAGRPAEEYEGVYFCGRQIAHLTLKVYPAGDPSRRSALFVFGPNDNSTEVPRGSFMVEGLLDAAAGAMTLNPVSWVSQPPGYGLLGLSGRSDDGGKTFRGRVTNSGICTQFTLARSRAAN